MSPDAGQGHDLALEAVAELMASLRDPADGMSSVTWSPVGEWGSFFARFVHLRSHAGREVAVKFGKGWSAADAEFVTAEIGRVRRLFAELPGGPVEVPPVLGWVADPAVIVLPFVSGENLFAALGQTENPIHRDPDRLRLLVEAAGEALGAYHAAEEAPADADIRRLTREDMAAAARRSGYRRSLVDRLEREIPVVRGYRLSHNDFTIGDSGDGGRLVILDPPHVTKFDHLHRDLSAFTLALHRALLGEAAQSGDHALHDSLRAAVVEGYRRTGPAQLDTELDDWLLRFYELSRIGSQMVGRIRSRKPGPALRSARWWLAERRRLGSPPVG